MSMRRQTNEYPDHYCNYYDHLYCMTTTVPFWSFHLDTDTRLLFCEDTYVEIQVEEDPTVESLFIIEVDKPLIVG